ncbi:MAG: hypothetical protein M1515_03030 [Candidatus Thermoplasmatota archaeon]|jgi:KaiC/GvpD/RAD55 family RecA-like ATPase|nr:hypothetical protein [Candidatus Thermoplasmatota archaeon]
MELVKTGIDGLDEMLGGGIPKGSTVLVLGSYGAGKTTMGIHFAFSGLKGGEKVAYFSLEERKDSIIAASKQYGMDLQPFLDNGLTLMNPGAGEFVEMLRMKENFKTSIEGFNVSRVIIDSVSIMLMAADNDVLRRNVVLNLSDSLKDLNVTTLMIAEAEVGSPYSTKEGLSEFVADGVISLQNIYNDSNGSVVSAARILKMRLTNHDRKGRPYTIGSDGIQIMANSDLYLE